LPLAAQHHWKCRITDQGKVSERYQAKHTAI
jgi:hypothetical protein